MCFSEVSVLRTGMASRLRKSMLEEYSEELPYFRIKKYSPDQLNKFLGSSLSLVDVFWKDEERFF